MHKTLARVVNNYALAVVNFMIDENTPTAYGKQNHCLELGTGDPFST